MEDEKKDISEAEKKELDEFAETLKNLLILDRKIIDAQQRTIQKLREKLAKYEPTINEEETHE